MYRQSCWRRSLVERCFLGVHTLARRKDGLETARGEMFDYSSRKLRLRKGSQILELPMTRGWYE